jgi:hypothetical protein
VPEIRRSSIAAAVLLGILLLHGMHMLAEAHTCDLAERFAQHLPACRAT